MPTDPATLLAGAKLRIKLLPSSGYSGELDAILSDPTTGTVKLQHALGRTLLPKAADYEILEVYEDGPGAPEPLGGAT